MPAPPPMMAPAAAGNGFGKASPRLHLELFIALRHHLCYAFEITDVKEDFRTKATYYVLEDDFTSHRMYFKDEQKYKIGDSCILEVSGITDKSKVIAIGDNINTDIKGAKDFGIDAYLVDTGLKKTK